ncbi:MAG: RsmE family RNA methyltransferase [bacterium]
MVIFVEEDQFSNILEGSETLEVNHEVYHYLKNVVRVQLGQVFTIYSLSNQINHYKQVRCKLCGFSKPNRLMIQIEQKQEFKNNLPMIDLYIVPLKSRYMDSCIEYCCQLPINRIYLIKSQHICVKFDEIVRKIDRLRKISYWNSVYSKKYYVTDVNFLDDNVKNIVDKVNDVYEVMIVFDNLIDREICLKNLSRIGVLIGPEGGWSTDEINYLLQVPKIQIFKFRNIHTTIKSEIAPIVGISQVLAMV